VAREMLRGNRRAAVHTGQASDGRAFDRGLGLAARQQLPEISKTGRLKGYARAITHREASVACAAECLNAQERLSIAAISRDREPSLPVRGAGGHEVKVQQRRALARAPKHIHVATMRLAACVSVAWPFEWGEQGIDTQIFICRENSTTQGERLAADLAKDVDCDTCTQRKAHAHRTAQARQADGRRDGQCGLNK
jgi:hypothetical protein